jgi:hypothetical protein
VEAEVRVSLTPEPEAQAQAGGSAQAQELSPPAHDAPATSDTSGTEGAGVGDDGSSRRSQEGEQGEAGGNSAQQHAGSGQQGAGKQPEASSSGSGEEVVASWVGVRSSLPLLWAAPPDMNPRPRVQLPLRGAEQAGPVDAYVGRMCRTYEVRRRSGGPAQAHVVPGGAGQL